MSIYFASISLEELFTLYSVGSKENGQHLCIAKVPPVSSLENTGDEAYLRVGVRAK